MILPSNIGQQPQYPQTNANVVYPQGIQLNVILAPGIAISVTVGADSVEQWLALWQQQKQGQGQEMKIIQHVQESKNGQH